MKTLREQLNPGKMPTLVPRKVARKLIHDAVLNCIKIKAAAIESVDKLLRKMK
jgi:hypothetical protein